MLQVAPLGFRYITSYNLDIIISKSIFVLLYYLPSCTHFLPRLHLNIIYFPHGDLYVYWSIISSYPLVTNPLLPHSHIVYMRNNQRFQFDSLDNVTPTSTKCLSTYQYCSGKTLQLKFCLTLLDPNYFKIAHLNNNIDMFNIT